jgi:glutaconate CoA-transferase subunit B
VANRITPQLLSVYFRYIRNLSLLDRCLTPDLYTMSDAPNVAGAAWATGLLEVMHLLQRGDVHLGFIGGAEVDRFGNINTSVIGSP